MKVSYLLLISFLIVGALFIPAVSAEQVLIDTESISETFTVPKWSVSISQVIDCIGVYRIETCTDLKFVYVNCPYVTSTSIVKASPWYSERVTLKVGSTTVGHGIAGYNGMFNSDGDVVGCQFYVDVTDFNPGTLTGTQKIEMVPDTGTLFNGVNVELSYGSGDVSNKISEDTPLALSSTRRTPYGTYQFPTPGNHIVRYDYYWENRLNIDKSNLHLIRNIDGNSHFSRLIVTSDAGTVNDISDNDITVPFVGDLNWSVTSSYGKIFTGTVESTDPTDSTTLIVYIKNSQTGALIANSNIVIDALVNGEYYPVVNRSEPSGIFSINLQPTGGGPPNPDSYRLIVTADGYNNPMPEINFTVDDYKQSIYCLLDPISGGPADENKTFIDFFVSDMYANPVPGATVKFGKYTLITNSAGYTVFEVPKNDYYTYTVSKSGYNTITGNANIGDAPRNTINTYLTPVTTPTTPTHIPTGPPTGPTPVMTAPTGEPVNNWLEWFAAHFGMILGGGVEIGKIFMWLCFTVPVGVYVGKEAKAGAAGFMAGAGIVTLFFVLIGWVPIWLVVLLALIIGLLYAKVFNTQDNGGGR
jgi:hypothetical protein